MPHSDPTPVIPSDRRMVERATSGTRRLRSREATTWPLLATDHQAAARAAILGAAIVLAAAIPLAFALNIWIDEAFTLHSTGAGVAYAWHEAHVFEAQPPLYFLIEAAWRRLDEGSIAFARFPSAIFCAAAVAVIVRAAHRLVPRLPPSVVAVVTAANPLVLWAATEMRAYALAFLIGSVLTWAFIEGFMLERRSRPAQLIYVVFAIAGLYTQYYAGFVLAAQALTVVLVRRSAVRTFAPALALVAVAFAPFTAIAIEHVTAAGGFVRHVSLGSVGHELIIDVFDSVLPHNFAWSAGARIADGALIIALIAAFVFARPAVRTASGRAVTSLWLAGIVTFALLFTATGLPYSAWKHLIVLAPVSLLAAFVAIDSVTRGKRRFETLALAAYALATVIALWTAYRPPLFKTGDWQRMAATLAAARSYPIAVFPAEFALPLTSYLPRPTTPVPGPMPFRYDYTTAMAPDSEAQVARALDPLRARSAQLWVVTRDACTGETPEPFAYNCRYLEAYLADHYRFARSIAFRGSLVRLYDRLPAASPRILLRP